MYMLEIEMSCGWRQQVSDRSGEHLSKLSLPWCPEQPWLKAQASQDGGKSVCSTEERQLPSNRPIFRREIPHISFPALKVRRDLPHTNNATLSLAFTQRSLSTGGAGIQRF